MKIACIYWDTTGVGGIATHLNNIRKEAIRQGDQFDILWSKYWKNIPSRVFDQRKRITGGNTSIWIDGQLNQTPAGKRWLEKNYDVIYFGTICPHKRMIYSEPNFLMFYDNKLPKIAGVTDGLWKNYQEWASLCIQKLKHIFVVQPTYIKPILESKLDIPSIDILLAPFIPIKVEEKRDSHPSLIWPNQWNVIKGVKHFIREIPKLSQFLNIDLYSNGLEYYRLRKTELWKKSVGINNFDTYSGNGKATFHGDVLHKKVLEAFSRSWFSCNLQGIHIIKDELEAKNDPYRQGSYNLTEIEALYYGCCPVLHQSVLNTILPKECILTVEDASQLPWTIKNAIKSNFHSDEKRKKHAKEFVMEFHSGKKHYETIKKKFES